MQNTPQEKNVTAAQAGSQKSVPAQQKAAAPRNVEQGPSKIESAKQYFEDAKKELGKVSWPTQKEVKATSIAVVVLVAAMSVYLGVVDLALTKLVEFILSM